MHAYVHFCVCRSSRQASSRLVQLLPAYRPAELSDEAGTSKDNSPEQPGAADNDGADVQSCDMSPPHAIAEHPASQSEKSGITSLQPDSAAEPSDEAKHTAEVEAQAAVLKAEPERKAAAEKAKRNVEEEAKQNAEEEAKQDAEEEAKRNGEGEAKRKAVRSADEAAGGPAWLAGLAPVVVQGSEPPAAPRSASGDTGSALPWRVLLLASPHTIANAPASYSAAEDAGDDYWSNKRKEIAGPKGAPHAAPIVSALDLEQSQMAVPSVQEVDMASEPAWPTGLDPLGMLDSNPTFEDHKEETKHNSDVERAAVKQATADEIQRDVAIDAKEKPGQQSHHSHHIANEPSASVELSPHDLLLPLAPRSKSHDADMPMYMKATRQKVATPDAPRAGSGERSGPMYTKKKRSQSPAKESGAKRKETTKDLSATIEDSILYDSAAGKEITKLASASVKATEDEDEESVLGRGVADKGMDRASTNMEIALSSTRRVKAMEPAAQTPEITNEPAAQTPEITNEPSAMANDIAKEYSSKTEVIAEEPNAKGTSVEVPKHRKKKKKGKERLLKQPSTQQSSTKSMLEIANEAAKRMEEVVAESSARASSSVSDTNVETKLSKRTTSDAVNKELPPTQKASLMDAVLEASSKTPTESSEAAQKPEKVTMAMAVSKQRAVVSKLGLNKIQPFERSDNAVLPAVRLLERLEAMTWRPPLSVARHERIAKIYIHW